MAPRIKREQIAVAAIEELARYMTPQQLKRLCGEQYGLDYTGTLEMAYENMLGTAKQAWARVRPRPTAAKLPVGAGVGIDDGVDAGVADSAQKKDRSTGVRTISTDGSREK